MTYYAKSTGDGTFNLYDTSANAIAGGATGRINTSGSQSGTHTVKSQKMLDLFSAYPGRWGSSGSERAYDGLVSWNSARSGASAFDTEVAEIGESYTEYLSGSFTTSIPSQQAIITTEINGVRSDGWHKGAFPSSRTLTSGYELFANSSFSGTCLTLGRYRDMCDGIIVRGNSWSCWALVIASKPLSEVRNCILTCKDVAGTGFYLNPTGVALPEPMAICSNNVIVGCASGIRLEEWKIGQTAIGNLVTLCTTGILGSGPNAYGFVYNNISVGNTTNWGASPTNLEGASNNAGLAGESWITGGGSRITIATTDFANYSTKDYRPASAASPQVETGAEPFGILPYDLAGRFRPDYMNGAAAYFDVGPYEFDHGYGPWPASTTVTFSGVAAGSEIRVYDASANELAGIENCASDQSLTWAIPSPATVRIVIVHPSYKIKEFTYTAQAGNQSIPVQQEADKWYSNPA